MASGNSAAVQVEFATLKFVNQEFTRHYAGVYKPENATAAQVEFATLMT